MLTTCTPTKHGYAMVLVMMYAQGKKKKRCQPNFFCPTLAQKSGLISSGQMNMIPIPPTPCGGWGDGLNFKNLLPQYNHHRRWKTISFPSKKVKPIQFLPEFMFSLSLTHTTIYWSPSTRTHNHLLKSFHHNPATSGTGSMLPSDKKEKDIDTNYIKHEYTMLEELYRTFILFHTKWQHTFPSLQNMEQKLRLPCCKTLTTPADFPKPLKSLKGL